MVYIELSLPIRRVVALLLLLLLLLLLFHVQIIQNDLHIPIPINSLVKINAGGIQWNVDTNDQTNRTESQIVE